MIKTIKELKKKYQTSSFRTPAYLNWHRLFKREFTIFLEKHGAVIVDIHKPNHFDASGFFCLKNGQSWFFRIDDLRWTGNTMLIRAVRDFEDFVGGPNKWARLDSVKHFLSDFDNIINIKENFIESEKEIN